MGSLKPVYAVTLYRFILKASGSTVDNFLRMLKAITGLCEAFPGGVFFS
jgi:hypothetical protein